MTLHVIILAAGQGTRMKSSTPKVLHTIGGQSMLARVIKTAQSLAPEAIHVVIGHESARIQRALSHFPVQWLIQKEQLGTGHAVHQALPALTNAEDVLILSADVPLIKSTTLQALLTTFKENHSALGLLLATVPDPQGLGRIIRNSSQQIYAIVEEKDASASERLINEIYSGICCVTVAALKRWLPQLTPHNAQKEYYLTDIIGLAAAEKAGIASIPSDDYRDILGVNNRLQLQTVERLWQERQAEALLLAGVGIADAKRIDIRGQLTCGHDVFLDINSVFSGEVSIGDGCYIGPHCLLNNVTLGAGCYIEAHSVLDGCVLAAGCHVGPFARLRPGTQLAAHCKIGNFVETKNIQMDEGSKANHLSYLGDATIGKKVNIGAGTITCNYDGANKHHTTIADEVFVGSGTQLVAPVTIEEKATIGAGSTIRKSVPAKVLTLTEATQKTINGWKRPEKLSIDEGS